MPTCAYAVTGTGSLCAIARDLIRDGHDPETFVTWARKGVPMFTADKPLAWWAERTIEENDHTSPRLRKLRPFPRALRAPGGKAAIRPSRPSDVSPYPEPEKGAPGAAQRGAEGVR